MAVPVTRLTNTGTLYTVGQFDEVSYSNISGYTKNLLFSSQTFIGWYGSQQDNSGYIIQNATWSPADDYTGVKLYAGTFGGTIQRVYQMVNYVGGETYTYSAYAKAAELYQITFFHEPTISRIGISVNLNTASVSVNNSYGSSPFNIFIYSVGAGWYRFGYSFVAPATERTASDIRLAAPYTIDNNSGLYIWGAQLELGAQATDYEPTQNYPGYVYVPQGFTSRTDPNGVATIGSFDEVSINPAANLPVNLLYASTTWAQGTANFWNTADGSNCMYPTVATLAPDGTYTAYKQIFPAHGSQYYATATGQGHWDVNGGLPGSIGTTYTFSVYAKAAEWTWLGLQFYDYVTHSVGSEFNLITGQADAGYTSSNIKTSMTNAGNGWYRCSITITVGQTPATGGAINAIYIYGNPNEGGYITSDGHSGIYLWGPQLEIGSTPTNYIPTTTAPSISNLYEQVPGFVRRIDNTGLHRIAGNYDEWTGVLATTNGLVTYLDAAVPASTTGSQTQWNDISGTGYGLNATYQNSQSLSTYNPALQAYNFNAPPSGTGGGLQGFQFGTSTTSYLRTPYFTMEVWVRHAAFNTNGKYGNYYTNWEWYQYMGFRFGAGTPNSLATDTTAAPIFWTNQSGGNFSTAFTGTYPILLNTWCQIAVTYDGSTCNVYVNGALYSTQANAVYVPGPPYNVNSFNIGGNDEGIQSWNGQMSIFRWYSRALSASELSDNFAGNRVRFGI